MPSQTTDRFSVLIILAMTIALTGCSLRNHRIRADEEAYETVAEKSDDPRWDQPDFTIDVDPRSRYYDGYDPDREPMPRDDPASARYMRVVDGKKGWPHWWDNGVTDYLENPYWREELSEYADLTEDGKLKLSIDSALSIAYINSPTYQEQLETLYLSALDVTTERFRFDTQFFAGNLTTFEHLGRLRGPVETNTLRTNNDVALSKRFATGGELLAGFANSFVWQFAGPDTNSSLTLLNFNLVQPLLRSGGRERALEQLTRVERGLLANLRQLERYRKGFYTQVAVGTLGVRGVSRLGGFTGGTGLTGFTGTGQGGLGGVGQATGFGGGFFGGGAGAGGVGGGTGLAGGGAGQVGGFIGLLQAMQEIRNSQYSLDLQLRTLALLEANLEAGTIDLTQVDQFRQSIETLRAQLLQARAGLQSQLDTYVSGILGLPPDMEVELDDEFIQQFQLIDPRVVSLQDEIAGFQDQLGALPRQNPSRRDMQAAIQQASSLLGEYRQLFGMTEQDIRTMKARASVREQAMTADEQQVFQRDMTRLSEDFAKLPQVASNLERVIQRFETMLSPAPPPELLPQLVGWTRTLSDEVQTLNLIQARARLEAVVVEPIELDARTGLQIARNNRLDYMNNRAALVDSWRLIAFNADQLKSVLDIEFDGDLRTVGNNPANFRGPTGRMTARVEFDAPLTRLLERNNYRQALIDYQRSRRQIVQFDDGLNQDIRARLRNLEQLRVNLEIQRRAVGISIRRVDFTRSELNAPLPTPEPGQAPTTFGPTAVQNLLSALSDLSNAQNAFMSVWLNYYSERMLLVQDLGIMRLDEEGRWIDLPIKDAIAQTCLEPELEELPPGIPTAFWKTLEQAEQVATQEQPAKPHRPTHGEYKEASHQREIPWHQRLTRWAKRSPSAPVQERKSGAWGNYR